MTDAITRLQARLRTLGEEKSKFTKADLEAYASNMNIEMTWLEGKYLAVELLARALTEQDVRDVQEVIAENEEAEGCLTRSGFLRSADGKLWIPPVNQYATKFHQAEAALAQKTRECEELINERDGLLEDESAHIKRADALQARVEQLGRQVAELSKPVTQEEWVFHGGVNFSEGHKRALSNVIAARAATGKEERNG